MSDPDGSYTIANLDSQGVDAAVVLPLDYDLCFGRRALCP